MCVVLLLPAGLPTPGTSLRVVHPETLAEVPDGEQGLLLARGPGVMAGYYADPGATAKVLHGTACLPACLQHTVQETAAACMRLPPCGHLVLLPILSACPAVCLFAGSLACRPSRQAAAGLTRETLGGGRPRGWPAAPWRAPLF